MAALILILVRLTLANTNSVAPLQNCRIVTANCTYTKIIINMRVRNRMAAHQAMVVVMLISVSGALLGA